MSAGVIVRPGAAALLEQAGLRTFDDFMRLRGDGVPVSRHVDRECVAVCLTHAGDSRPYYLKRWWSGPGWHWPGRSSPQELWREWQTLVALRADGLAAMTGVAVGRQRRGGRTVAAFLLVEAAPMERTAADWLADAKLSPRLRRGLLRRMGVELGRLHALKRRWRDLHPRHVFAAHGSHGWELCLIDLERVGSMRKRDVAGDLWRCLRRVLPYEPTRMEQRAFACGYLAGRDGAAARRGRAAHWRAAGLAELGATAEMCPAGSRTAAVNRPAAGLASQGLERQPDGIWLNALDAEPLAAIGLANPAALLRGPLPGADRLDKHGLPAHRQRARVTVESAGAAASYFVKRVERPPMGEQLRRLASRGGRDSTAWRESHMIRRLSEAGLPTMRCAAVAEEMAGPWERRSAIVVAAVPGESLERWLPRAWGGLTRPDRTALVTQVAAVARVMHKAELFHRDLYPAHLFVAWPAPRRPVVHVIDVARMLERPRRRERWRVKDLAALHYGTPAIVGRTDRLRFLRRYAGWLDGPGQRAARHDWMRRVIGQVERRARRMATHDARRGRGAAGAAAR